MTILFNYIFFNIFFLIVLIVANVWLYESKVNVANELPDKFKADFLNVSKQYRHGIVLFSIVVFMWFNSMIPFKQEISEHNVNNIVTITEECCIIRTNHFEFKDYDLDNKQKYLNGDYKVIMYDNISIIGRSLYQSYSVVLE